VSKRLFAGIVAMKFELNSLPRNCSNEEILAEIRRVDSNLANSILTREEFDEHGKISSSTIIRRFGGWQKALIAAGLEQKYSGTNISEKMRRQKARQLPDEAVLAELNRLAKHLGKESLTVEDLRNHSALMSEGVVRRRFGSWAIALEKAGLKISEHYNRRYSNEEYFENLLNVWTHFGRQPLYREMDVSPSVISSGAYENRFGNWRKALEAFVALMNQDEVNNRVDEDLHEKPQPLAAADQSPLPPLKVKANRASRRDRKSVV